MWVREPRDAAEAAALLAGSHCVGRGRRLRVGASDRRGRALCPRHQSRSQPLHRDARRRARALVNHGQGQMTMKGFETVVQSMRIGKLLAPDQRVDLAAIVDQSVLPPSLRETSSRSSENATSRALRGDGRRGRDLRAGADGGGISDRSRSARACSLMLSHTTRSSGCHTWRYITSCSLDVGRQFGAQLGGLVVVEPFDAREMARAAVEHGLAGHRVRERDRMHRRADVAAVRTALRPRSSNGRCAAARCARVAPAGISR